MLTQNAAGRGGESLKLITRTAGAKVVCSKERSNDPGAKGNITVTGTKQEVKLAKVGFTWTKTKPWWSHWDPNCQNHCCPGDDPGEGGGGHDGEGQDLAVFCSEAETWSWCRESEAEQHRDPDTCRVQQQQQTTAGWRERTHSQSRSRATEGGDKGAEHQQTGPRPGRRGEKSVQLLTFRNLQVWKWVFVSSPDIHLSWTSSWLMLTISLQVPSPDLSFQPDEHLEVYVSASENPNHFWIQILGVRSLQLDKLNQEMNRFYSSGNPEVSSLCFKLRVTQYQ